MSLVTTLPLKGEAAKVYDIPDSDLAKYQALETNQTPYEEGQDKIAKSQQMAGGLDLDKADVQAYSHICICWIRWGHTWYYRYQYCWQSCP
jgi:hypothetical protein